MSIPSTVAMTVDDRHFSETATIPGPAVPPCVATRPPRSRSDRPLTTAPVRRRSGPDALSGRRRVWTLVLDAVVLLPLVAAVVSPASRTFSAAINLSAGIGLVATSTLAVVLLLVSRVRGLTRVLGLELGNHLHRRLGVAALSFTCAHVVAAVSASSRGWALLNPVWAPRRRP